MILDFFKLRNTTPVRNFKLTDTSTARKAIKVAIKRIEEKSCLKFIPWTNESDFLSFFEGEGCFSPVGRVGGEQVQKNDCFCKLLHALSVS